MKTKFFLIILGIMLICLSCEPNMLGNAYIINTTDVPIVLYTESDSVVTFPLKRTYLAGGIIVENDVIVSWNDSEYDFNIGQSIKRIGLPDTIYTVPEQYSSMLVDLENYTHFMSIHDSNTMNKHYANSYEFYLTENFIHQITAVHLKK
jgi:hypothetical protein